ncbi:hypothetical protein ABIF93_003289 [Bradyrhizobium japonicum]
MIATLPRLISAFDRRFPKLRDPEWAHGLLPHLGPVRGGGARPRGSLQIPPGVVSQIPPPARQDKGLLV